MALKLYMRIQSPACRAVLMTAKALSIELETIHVPMGDTLKPEYIKMNPQHTIPTLDDNGKIIWDSHAINIYLVSKYGKNDSLYPSDPYKRAIVDQRLHFDSGVLFAASKQIRKAIVEKKLKSVPDNLIATLEEAYGFMEKFLDGHQWIAGDDLTLADISLIPTITSLERTLSFDEKKYPNINAWVKRAEMLPYYDINREGLKALMQFFSSL